MKRCWSCHDPIPAAAIFCSSCSKVQPLDTHFDSVDERHLKKRWLQLMQDVHPDNYATKSREELSFAEMQSTFINEGYRTLKDPVARAKYTLKLNGIEISESDSIKDNQDLIMEVLDAREALEEGATEEEVTVLKTQNAERMRNIITELERAFTNPSDSTLARAKNLTIELQYWKTFENEKQNGSAQLR
ncbi:hypothetical protein BJ742DRAFT_492551 [Cladochytrium replicatum]|nr:hypothetical protein BJ742DRAFT_492551 [Cladochytrium replicatum]